MNNAMDAMSAVNSYDPQVSVHGAVKYLLNSRRYITSCIYFEHRISEIGFCFHLQVLVT
jgi:hypothetical protein